MASLKLEVISPDAVVHQAEVQTFNILSTEGWLGILPRHAPMIASVETCAAKMRMLDNTEALMAVSGGFMEVRDNKITLLVTAAETPEKIDVLRAQKSYQRAKERIQKFNHSVAEAQKDIDMPRAEASMQRAIARLKVAGGAVPNL